MKHLSRLLVPAALLVFSLGANSATQDETPKPLPKPTAKQDEAKPAVEPELTDAEKKAIIAVQSKTYPLRKCLISGEALKDPLEIVREGKLVRVCCSMCVDVIDTEPKRYIKELDQAVVKAQISAYPTVKCIVTDKRLSAESAPIEFVHGLRLVRLNDEEAKATFLKDPAKYHAALDKQYMDRQQWDYPLDYCPISKNKLDDKAVDVLYGNTLVKLCCTNCKKAFAEKALYCAVKVRNARTKKTKKSR